MTHGRATLLAMIPLLALAPPARAQSAPATEDRGPAGSADIVVTAQRREESLQDVPISMAALSGATIEESGIGRLEDFSFQLPNVYITPRELRNTGISIRGISADLNNPGLDQSVGVYVDGVYMGRAATLNAALFDLDRIEVLRGPQGTLYGRNTIAGAMNIITRKPGDEARLDAEGSYGDYDSARANASASGPLQAGRLAVGIGASIDRRDGFYRNIATNTRLDDVGSLGARAALRMTPSDSVELILRADISRDRTHSGAYDVLDNGAFAGTPFADSDPDDRRVAQDLDTVQNRDIKGVSGELDIAAGGGTITSVTAVRGYKWHNIQDNDYSVLDMLATGIDEDQSQVSQELRYVSSPSRRLAWVAGLYYFRQALDTFSNVVLGPDLGIYPTPTRLAIHADVGTDSYAAFGRASWAFSPLFTLSAGARYTREKKRMLFSQEGDPFEVVAPTIGARRIGRRDAAFSPSATIEWRPRSGTLAYATISRGFKSGGFNVFSVTATDDAEYRPETVTNYEAGLKTDLLRRRLRLSAALFYMRYRDLQQNQLITTGSGIGRFQTSNAARAHTAGGELEIAARLAAAVQLTAAYGYADARFDSYPGATPAGADFTGHRLAFAPRHTASAAAEWSPRLGDGVGLFARGEAAYRSRLFFGSDNLFSAGDLLLLNARLGVGPPSGGWRATLWVRNLADARYPLNIAAGAVVPGQVIQALGAPRTYGVEARFSF